jgi:hypothetical protein
MSMIRRAVDDFEHESLKTGFNQYVFNKIAKQDQFR